MFNLEDQSLLEEFEREEREKPSAVTRLVLCDFGEDRIGDYHENKKSSATHHFAEMVAYMGLPSAEYIQRSQVTGNVFDDTGRWKAAGCTPLPDMSLEESVTSLRGEEKAKFLRFVRSMLQWEPEKKKPASAPLQDPFMVGAIPRPEE
ncbi:hypothetical protein NLG97_g2305 [Lecanicillium saksenae]|uniref:Uncharacterized protein n=1 Tax=Lecanicillium saksenae TaxID=468837 RepID=A0ACC1R1H9_9HYPO|nr:hypothetical protein NLG97_g2305 [Lecanicillium saksenae]